MTLRIGQGFDVHRVVPERCLFLGGVNIPWDCGLLGHSDADVLIHAVIDAYLGALALGDIGQWFPDTDEQYAGISSCLLLQRVLQHQEVIPWQLVNMDATIIAQRPRLAAYIPQMRESLAVLLGVGINAVSVKATTTETLGFAGRGEGIAAQCVVLLGRRDH